MGRPLEGYLRRLRRGRRPVFAASSTALWRGYVGTWEIRDGMLTLVDLVGSLVQGETIVQADLRTAFPWAGEAIPATWVTDAFRCVEGRLVSYVHAGFGSSYERDRMFEFERGRLVSEVVTLNPPEPLMYRIRDDGGRVFLGGDAETDDPLNGEPFERVYDLVWSKRPDDAFGDDDENEERVDIAAFIAFGPT